MPQMSEEYRISSQHQLGTGSQLATAHTMACDSPWEVGHSCHKVSGQSVLTQHRARSGTLCRPSRETNADIRPQDKASQHCQRPLP